MEAFPASSEGSCALCGQSIPIGRSHVRWEQKYLWHLLYYKHSYDVAKHYSVRPEEVELQPLEAVPAKEGASSVPGEQPLTIQVPEMGGGEGVTERSVTRALQAQTPSSVHLPSAPNEPSAPSERAEAQAEPVLLQKVGSEGGHDSGTGSSQESLAESLRPSRPPFPLPKEEPKPKEGVLQRQQGEVGKADQLRVGGRGLLSPAKLAQEGPGFHRESSRKYQDPRRIPPDLLRKEKTKKREKRGGFSIFPWIGAAGASVLVWMLVRWGRQGPQEYVHSVQPRLSLEASPVPLESYTALGGHYKSRKYPNKEII